METCNATILGDILYIDAPKKKFLPSYVYYLLQSKKCTKVCFGARKVYYIENLKGKENWKDVDKKPKKKDGSSL